MQGTSTDQSFDIIAANITVIDSNCVKSNENHLQLKFLAQFSEERFTDC